MIIRVILTSYELWDNFQTRAEFEARCWAHVNVSTHVDYLHMRIRLEKMCSTDSFRMLTVLNQIILYDSVSYHMLKKYNVP